MTPPDDLPSPKGLACDSLLKRAKARHASGCGTEMEVDLVAALESDRAKLAEAQQTIADFERQGVLLNEEGLKLDAERAADRALLRRIGDALNTWDAIAPTVLNAPTSLFVRTVRSIIDEARVRVGEGK